LHGSGFFINKQKKEVISKKNLIIVDICKATEEKSRIRIRNAVVRIRRSGSVQNITDFGNTRLSITKASDSSGVPVFISHRLWRNISRMKNSVADPDPHACIDFGRLDPDPGRQK
jgi:hypothetical protein